ncbi:hypothetical protein KX928_17085 [Roseobacter sp. YSTF-M11]|uniref:CMD domain protein n=1 Tax=Roseobacter insulae TaxID=2859783 RepID=A0A9X1FXK3_9RHOB|nr:hypothetical protein [Roseobacter insulae]MBW4709507.1 hypothetical protein [Roseobacter insulae]
MTLFETTILKKSGLTPDSGLASAASSRANIFNMSQAAEQAVLRPEDCGAFGHDLRAALAARVARQAGEDALADHYASAAGDKAGLADPGVSDADQGHILTFVDKVANQTRDVAAEDISGLQAAGVSDADVVRLCELVAFLAYQTRVIAGLRLMQGTAG